MKRASERTKTGRSLYEDSGNFESTVTTTVFSNYRFIVQDLDHGTWRRILAYWPKCRFVNDPDPNNPFEKKIEPSYGRLAAENKDAADALFSILVHYRCELVRKYGGILSAVVSPTIKKETEEYQVTQDNYTEYIKRRLIRLAGFNTDTNYSRIDIPAILERYNTPYVTIIELINDFKNWNKDIKGKEISHNNDRILNLFKESLGVYFSDRFADTQLQHESLIGFRIGYDKDQGEYFI
jgi:hypothetical protein